MNSVLKCLLDIQMERSCRHSDIRVWDLEEWSNLEIKSGSHQHVVFGIQMVFKVMRLGEMQGNSVDKEEYKFER